MKVILLLTGPGIVTGPEVVRRAEPKARRPEACE